jgi:ATP-dependent Clp protease ATP-binding subunit ClpA
MIRTGCVIAIVAVWSLTSVFEIFTPDAILSLTHAQEEALRFRCDSTEPEHVLLGLLQKANTPKDIFKNFGFTCDDVCREFENVIGPRL